MRDSSPLEVRELRDEMIGVPNLFMHRPAQSG